MYYSNLFQNCTIIIFSAEFLKHPKSSLCVLFFPKVNNCLIGYV